MKFDSLETEELEYIKSAAKFKRAAISLSAMLNAHGHGVVYLGVKKDGTVVGRDDLSDMDCEVARDFLKRHIEPCPPLDVSVVCGEDDVCCVKIEAYGSERPYSASGKYYIRYGTEDRVMSREQIVCSALSSATDLLVATPSARQDLDFSQLKAFCKSAPSRDEMRDDIANLQTADGKFNMLAYMVSDDNDLFVRVCGHEGAEDILPDGAFGGKCMLSVIKEVEDCILALGERASSAKTGQLFDTRAFKAAWRIAFLHNAWYKAVAPRIDVFRNRMEIVSEGGLAEGMSEKELLEGGRSLVDLNLTCITEKLGLMAEDDYNVSLVTDVCGKDSFKISDNCVVIEIPFAFEIGGGNVRLVSSAEIKRVPVRDRIISLIEENPYITADQMSVRCNVSKSTISNTMSQMVRDGVIVREGSKKTGKWKVL